MKMKVHNELGDNLRMIQYMLDHEASAAEELEYFRHQENIMRAMSGDSKGTRENALEEFHRVLSRTKRKLEVNGEIPENQRIQSHLLAALRECLNNMLRHSDGDTLHLDIQEESDCYRFEISNNGTQPKEIIQEGGGLTALRSRIESIQGEMEIRSLPRYMVIIEIPKEKE